MVMGTLLNNRFKGITRDRNFNRVNTTKTLKIPRYNNIKSLGNNPGSVGNIVLDKSSDQLCYHTGTKWLCVSGGSSGGEGEIQTSFVYQPDGLPPTKTKNVYNDWSLMMDDVNKFSGKRFITVDDSVISPAVVPAGVWDMSNITLRGSATTKTGGGERRELEVSDGATLPNLSLITDWLLVISESTSAVTVLGSGVNSRLELDNNSCLVARNGAPFIEVNGTSRIILRDQSILERGGAGGNEVVVDYLAGSSGSIRMGERSRIMNNTLRTAGGVNINIVFQASSATLGNEPQAAGLTEVLRPDSVRVSYDNSTSGLTAVEVQSAIDELAGASGGDVSGSGSSTDNAIVRWDGTTGTMIQNSGVDIDDMDNLTTPGILIADNYKRGVGIPFAVSGSVGDLYQQEFLSPTYHPSLYINIDGGTTWKKINVMENIVFTASDMTNVGLPGAATVTTRNGRPCINFPQAVSVPTRTEAIFQGYLSKNYNVNATLRYEVIFATTTAASGNLSFNIAWERLEPGVSNVDTDNFIVPGTVPIAIGGPAGTVQVSSNTLSPTLLGNAPPGEGFRIRFIRWNSGDTVADSVDVLRIALYEEEQ